MQKPVTLKGKNHMQSPESKTWVATLGSCHPLCASASDSFFTILALYKFSCMYVCRRTVLLLFLLRWLRQIGPICLCYLFKIAICIFGHNLLVQSKTYVIPISLPVRAEGELWILWTVVYAYKGRCRNMLQNGTSNIQWDLTGAGRAGLRHWAGVPCRRVMGDPLLSSLFIPSPHFPSPFSHSLHCSISTLPSPPLEVGPQNTARGLGERCKVPQWGMARSASRQAITCIFESKGAALVATIFVEFLARLYVFSIIFCTIIINLQKLCPKLQIQVIEGIDNGRRRPKMGLRPGTAPAPRPPGGGRGHWLSLTNIMQCPTFTNVYWNLNIKNRSANVNRGPHTMA